MMTSGEPNGALCRAVEQDGSPPHYPPLTSSRRVPSLTKKEKDERRKTKENKSSVYNKTGKYAIYHTYVYTDVSVPFGGGGGGSISLALESLLLLPRC